jgi:polysaccharide biosynthesis protein PslG
MLAMATLLAVVLPVLASCGGPTEAPATSPTAALPTAAVATQPATSAPATSLPQPTDEQGQPTGAPAEPTIAPATEPPAGMIIEPGQPIRLKYLNFGIVNHLYYTDRERVLTLDTIAGFDWVRQQIVWKDVEGPAGQYAWGELDKIVDDVAAHKMNLLVNIVQAPSFYNETNGLPADPVSLGNFLDALVQRYGQKIAAIEIWNEQNLAHENGGHVTVDDAGHYVDILVEAYNRIKAINPNIVVLAGAPSASGVNDPAVAVPDEAYYRAMYEYKDGIIKNHFDVQAVHPGGHNNPPEAMWPDNPGPGTGCAAGDCWTKDPTFYFRYVEFVRRFMEEEGVGDHQIWVTEYGWATENNTPQYEFGNANSFDQQRDYIVGALKWAYDNYRYPDGSPWLANMFLWNMNFAPVWSTQNPLHEQASYGILNPDYSPRPAFLAIQGLLPQLKKDQGR